MGGLPRASARGPGRWDDGTEAGPWNLELVTTSVTEQTMTEYSRPVDSD